jgi:hypothetical protein
VSKKRKQNGKRCRRERDPWINRWVRQSDMRAHPTQVMDLNFEDVIHEYDSVYTTLGRAGDRAGEEWLWCLHCCRFFQAKHLRYDRFGAWQQCPFDDCGAAGFDVDILPWNNGAYEPGWPASPDELWHGREYPPRPDVSQSGN